MTRIGVRASLAGVGLALIAIWSAPVSALTLEVSDPSPSVVGASHRFKAIASEAVGAVKYEWRFGDAAGYVAGEAETAFTFTAPGHYSVDVVATDSTGESSSAFIQHLVHFPLTAKRPTSSTSIVFDPTRNRIYSLNQDNDSVTSIDAAQLTKIADLPVYHDPEALAIAPNGKLWIAHKGDYAIAVVDLDQFVIEKGFRLPYASQPAGLAMSPTGDAAYVTLMAVGKVLKLDPGSGSILAEAQVGDRPRGLSVSHDGQHVFVTRFISTDTGGEVVKLSAATLQIAARIALKLDTETLDSDQRARGVPNYLFSIALTPDGRQAWIPAKKDNIVRGLQRDGLKLTHDSTVRPLVAVLDALGDQELYGNRIDLDDRGPPVHIEFTPFGDLAIIALAGSNRIEVRDVNRPTQVFSAIPDAGTFPRASVLAADGHLFVQGSLSRNVLVYDLSRLLKDFDKSTPAQLAIIPAVSAEKLSPSLLLGKKLFHDSTDNRISFEGYLSCGACHFEGLDDGRVYDFSDRGEGLRNTMALRGHRGAAQGRLNWTGNLDELQDLEHLMREQFDGKGLIPDEIYHTGTRDQPLGDPKSGLSVDLDALAAYVSSLDRANPSPYRNPDGSMTADAVSGRALFQKLGCDFCHGGADHTDSARGVLHDVGTSTASSGQRAGMPLNGLDSPTLLGVWETPPYLHDGSAKTLRDVLVSKNPNDAHGYVSSLSPAQVDQLVAYVQQIDGDQPPRRLPFEAPLPASGGTGGTGGQAAGGGSAGSNGMSPGLGGTFWEAPGEPAQTGEKKSFLSCSAATTGARSALGHFFITAVLGLAALRRLRRVRHRSLASQEKQP
ncbi:MAG TPA: PKD domain-containing protein [Polyangiaceae bacterium]|nr:PKD domain-containing protein [Polyangiaceae bacterium]